MPSVAHNGEVKFRTLFGWGIVVYAIAYLSWAGLSMWDVVGLSGRLIELAILVVTLSIAGHSLLKTSWKDVLPYSIVWTLIAMILDTLYVLPIATSAMYSDWALWLGYALVTVVPLLAPYMRPHKEVPRIT